MLMHELELEGLLDRELEALPSTEQLAERQRQGRGLTRPELAVLLAYAKRSLYPEGARLGDPRRPGARRRPARVLPAPRRRGDRRAVPRAPPAPRDRGHVRDQRRRQLARASPGSGRWWPRPAPRRPRWCARYWIAREVTGAVGRWEEVEALFADPAVDTDVQMELMGGVDWLVEGVSRWYLQHASEGEAAGVIARDRASFSELSQTLRGVGSDAWRAEHALRREALAQRGRAAAAGRGRGLAARARRYAPDVIAAARATGCSLAEAAHAFFALGERAAPRLARAAARRHRRRDALAALGARRGARRAARHAARPDRAGDRRRAAARRSTRRSSASWPSGAAAVARVERLVASLRADGIADTAAAMVGVRQVRSAFA